jgi:cytochrome c oxidase cbb3-type subunit 3
MRWERTTRAASRILASVLLPALLLVACKREERRFREPAPYAGKVETIRLSDLHPGPGPTMDHPYTYNSYETNAWALSEGKRLYEWFNCVGCHAHGGGSIGPPLMDSLWIYGSDPANIFATIVEGRPNGMPSFRGRIPDHQVWQIVAYVRSLSGQLRKDVAPNRDDDMQVKQSEQQTEQQLLKNSTLPPE